MFSVIDKILLEKFQQMSNWFQEHLGINNFLISKILGVIMIILICLERLPYFTGGEILEMLIFPFSILSIFFCFLLINEVEKKVKNGENKLKSHHFFSIVRRVFYFVSLFLLSSIPAIIADKNNSKIIGDLLFILKEILLFFLMYFVSCTPILEGNNNKIIKKIKKIFFLMSFIIGIIAFIYVLFQIPHID